MDLETKRLREANAVAEMVLNLVNVELSYRAAIHNKRDELLEPIQKWLRANGGPHSRTDRQGEGVDVNLMYALRGLVLAKETE